MAEVAEVQLTGHQKAAMLILILGNELSSSILKLMKSEEVEKLVMQIAGIPRIGSNETEAVLKEFQEKIMSQQFVHMGGSDYARQLLSRAYGDERANEIMSNLSSSIAALQKGSPLEFLKTVDSTQLLSAIQSEHPQTIALVLSNLPAKKATEIMAKLSEDIQGEVSRRIALMKPVSPKALQGVAKILEKKIGRVEAGAVGVMGGIDTLVNMLKMSKELEKEVLSKVEETDPELAEQVRKKIFLFEDILLLDDRSVQTVLRDVDSSDLPVALKGATEEIQEKIFKNMAQRAAQMVKDELSFLGAVRPKDIEEAQQKIIAVIRQLEESGDIVIPRAGE
ncbi:MAG: flagellar motor switch protein FliG [bacterium]